MSVGDLNSLILSIAGFIITMSATTVILVRIVKNTIVKYSKESIDSSIKIAVDKFDQEITKLRDELKLFIKDKNDLDNKLKIAMMRNIKDRINQAHDYYMSKGYIGNHTMSILEELFSSYTDLSGNDFIHSEINDLRELKKLSAEQLYCQLEIDRRNNNNNNTKSIGM